MSVKMSERSMATRTRGSRAMRKQAIFVAIAVAVMSAFALSFSDVASAKRTQFQATYVAYDGTTWQCSGAHAAPAKPRPRYEADLESCLVSGDTSSYTAGTYTGNPLGVGPNGDLIQWVSDYNGALASGWMMTATDNGDGTFTIELRAAYKVV
jgi:hypothetical protein